MKFKRSPEEVKRYDEDVLVLAQILEKGDLEEVASWPIEDRRQMIVVWRAQQENAKAGQ